MTDVAETIDASARRIGHHAWVEMRLFETLGRWSATVADPRAKALLASQSRHHAWHAELWCGLLPALPHLPAADLVAPADGDSEMIASLAGLDSPEAVDDRPRAGAGAGPGLGTGTGGGAGRGAGGTSGIGDVASGTGGGAPGDGGAGRGTAAAGPTDAARLAAIYEVALPRVLAAYEDHQAHTTPVSDGPTIRALRLTMADLAYDRRAGLDLLGTLAGAG